VSTLEGPGPFTVLAPTNDAFAAVPAAALNCFLQPENKDQLVKLLTYHVVSGNVSSSDLHDHERIPTVDTGYDVVATVGPAGVFFNMKSKVILANQEASNGVAHVINNVLIPAGQPLACLGGSLDAPTKNIVQLAEATPDLSVLVKLVSDAGLVSTLEGPGPFTVLAPTNEAFQALPTAVVGCLLNHMDQLKTVLTYHVISGDVQSSDLHQGEIVPTVDAGQSLRVELTPQGVFFQAAGSRAKVVTANVEATNGVVHVIDHVLVPGNGDLTCLRGNLRSTSLA